MMTGEIRSKIDAVWNAFWAGGIANPLEVIEQITYLLFLRRLDDLQEVKENKARLGTTLIEIPPIDLQRQFVAHVAAVEKLKSAHRASLAKLDELFASLQHRAFRGEL
jgi:hypothetical protein